MAELITLLLISILMIVALVAIVLQCLQEIRLNKEGATFPGPRALPIIGNAHYFIGNTKDIWNKCIELFNSYPSPFRFRLANRQFFVAYDPETLKEIFLNPKFIDKEDYLKYGYPWMGTGLITAPAAKWKVHRKLITPMFSTSILETFVEIYSTKARIMAKQMEIELYGKEFDISQYITRLTHDSVCESILGTPSDTQIQKEVRFPIALKRMLEIFLTRCFKIWLHSDFIFYHSKYGKEQDECLKYLHGHTRDIIQRRKQVLKSDTDNPNYPDETVFGIGRKWKSLLDHLMGILKDGKKLTDDELREEVDTIVVAGTDTTATAEIFIFLILATFPDVQEEVYKELYKIYGDADINEVPVSHEDLHGMKYMERVIKETLRIFPPVPIYVKRPTEDVRIGKHTILKRNSVFIPAIRTHRNEEYWKDPMKFDPDRFLPEEWEKRNPYTYIPFSGGLRNCIGMKYAMMSMKTFTATIIRKYIVKKSTFVPLEEIKLTGEVVLKPVEPIMFKIERRNKIHNHKN